MTILPGFAEKLTPLPDLTGPLDDQPTWDEVFEKTIRQPMAALGTVTTDPGAVGTHDFYMWEGPDLTGKGRYYVPHVQRAALVPNGWRSYCDRESIDLGTESGRADFATRHRDWAAGLSSDSSEYATTVYTEIDDGTVEEQVDAITKLMRSTGLVPAMVLHSGGKSLHVHYLLDQPLSVDDPRRVRVHDLLAVALAGDQSVRSVNRKMRRPAWTGRRKQKLWLWEPQAVFIEDLLDGFRTYVRDELGIDGHDEIGQALRDLADAHQLDLYAGRVGQALKMDDDERRERRSRASQRARGAAAELRTARGSTGPTADAVRGTVRRLLSIMGSRRSRTGRKVGRKLGTTRSGLDLMEIPSSEWPSLMPGRQECPWCDSILSGSPPPLEVSTDCRSASCFRGDCNAHYIRVDDTDDFLKANPEITLLGQLVQAEDGVLADDEEHVLTVDEVLNSITTGPAILDSHELLEKAVRARASRIDDAVLAYASVGNPRSEPQNAECRSESIYTKKEDLYRFGATNGDPDAESLISVRWNCNGPLTSVKGKPGEAVRAHGLRCLSKTCPTCAPLMAMTWEAALEATLVADFGDLNAKLVLGPTHKLGVSKKTLERWTDPTAGGARNHWVEMRLTMEITVSLFLFDEHPKGKFGKALRRHGIPADVRSVMQLVRIDPSTVYRGGARFRWVTASTVLLRSIESLHAHLIRRPSQSKEARTRRTDETKETVQSTKPISLRTRLPVAEVVDVLQANEQGLQVEGRTSGTLEAQWAEVTGEAAFYALKTAVDDGSIPAAEITRRKTSELEAVWTAEMEAVEFTFDDFMV